MAVYTQVKQIKSAKSKPLVISVQNSHLKKTLVIAVTGAQDSDSSRNVFGTQFRRAAEALQIKTKHDGFDSSMIEMKNEDFRRFMEEMTNYQ